MNKEIYSNRIDNFLFYEVNPIPMWVYDLNSLKFLSVNDSAVAEYGYSREEFLNMTIKDIRPEEDVNSLIQNVLTLLPGYSNAGIWRHLKKNGEVKFVEISGYVFDYNGTPSELILAKDVTNYIKTALNLLESEERYKSLIESQPDAICLWKPDTTLIYANKEYCSIFGKNEEEIKGTKWIEFVPLEIREKVKSDYQELVKNPRLIHYEHEIYNKDNEKRYIHWIDFPVIVNGVVTGFQSVGRDITEQKITEKNIYRMGHFDSLTSLPNKIYLRKRFEEIVQKNEYTHFALLLLDLDNFKNLNDSIGHQFGDRFLLEIKLRILSICGKNSLVCRVGGDGFAILYPGPEYEMVSKFASEINSVIADPFESDGYRFTITTSIGISIFPEDGNNFHTLFKNADIALYHAKNSGRNTWSIFKKEMENLSIQKWHLEFDLRDAIKFDQLELYYQPIYDISGKNIISAEALVRWNHPNRGQISPAVFIPIAEETGLILEMGIFILKKACKFAKKLLDDYNYSLQISVNISPNQIASGKFIETLQSILTLTNLPAKNLCLEITESSMMTERERSVLTSSELLKLGVNFSIDDFGTGYSNLIYLKKFPVQKLKIDKGFICDLKEQGNDRDIVRAIIGMADALGFETIAEGVETEEQLKILKEEGCKSIQGYLFAKPMPEDKFIEWIQTHPQC